MSRPRILIPARFSTSASALRHEAEVAARRLVGAVFAAGGEPLVIHPHAPGGAVDPQEIAARLTIADGVLLPGGGDISARWTAQDPDPSLYDVDEEQDGFDLALARHCLQQGVPMLAICRGLQVVNIVRGGLLIQDMDSAGLANHRHLRHQVSVEAGTRLAQAVGERAAVSCYHHQCLSRNHLGSGLRVIAHADDGVVEAVELQDATGWFMGVQWHPEDTWEQDPAQFALFESLVQAARR